MSQPQPDFPAPLPAAISVLGWIALPGAVALAARLFYEQGPLPWQHGPQSVGFRLVHVHPGLFVFMIGSALLAHVYLLLAIGAAIWRLVHKTSFPGTSWIQIALLSVCVAISDIPYSAWQVAVIKFAGTNGHAAEYMCLASSQGQSHVLRAVLETGVSPDIKNRDGQAALDTACAAKQTEMVAYLRSRGANLDLAPHCPASRARFKVPPGPNPNLLQVPGEVVEVH